MAVSEDDLKVENARNWESFLGGLNRNDQTEASKIINFEDFYSWCKAHSITENPFFLWEARGDFVASQTPITEKPSEENPPAEAKNKDQNRPRHREQHAHPPTYDEFKEQVKKKAEEKAAAWEKNPDLTKAKTKEEAYELANREAHDKFVKNYSSLSEDWAKKHSDEHFIAALGRKKVEDEAAKSKASQGIGQSRGATIRDILSLKPIGKVSPSSMEGTIKNINPFKNTRVIWRRIPQSLSRPTVPFSFSKTFRQAGGAAFGGITWLGGRANHQPSARALAPNLKKKAKKRVLLWIGTSFGLPILVALLPFILIFVVVVSIIGAAAQDPLFAAQIGLELIFPPPDSSDPDPGPDPGPAPDPGPLNIPPCNEVWEGLRTDFGVSVLVGDSLNRYDGGGETCYMLQAIYRNYAISSKSSKYYSLLREAGPFRIRMIINGVGNCSGTTYGVIKLYVDPGSCFHSSGPDYLILHETGHQIRQNTQPKIMTESRHAELVRQDPNCYDNGFLKTYALRSTNPMSESSAEAVALYITGGKNSKWGASIPILNFKSSCPNTWEDTKRWVYDPYEFH